MPRVTVRLRRLLGELDYAQRRTLELRTGVALTGPQPRSRRARREIAALDRAWAAPVAAPNPPGRLNHLRSRPCDRS